MFLDLEKIKFPMKKVFSLSQELSTDPERIALAQALTKDESRPFIGLKGNFGLFGSKEWWASIDEQRIPLLFVSGKIKEAYVAGQDQSATNNTIDLVTPDGRIVSVGIYVNDDEDVPLFREGSWVEMVYALDELKMQPASDGGTNYSKVALEVAVSLEPIK
jgi:hypothetical protein